MSSCTPTHSFTHSLTRTIPVAIVLVAAQFKDLNQFLWIAWFQVACGLTIIVLMLLFFRDKVFVPSFPLCKSVQRSRKKRKASTAALEPSVPCPVKWMVIFVSLQLRVYTHKAHCVCATMVTVNIPRSMLITVILEGFRHCGT